MEATMYEKLLRMPLFQGLERDELTRILEKMKIHFQRYAAKSYIVKQGDPCGNIVFVLSGQICIQHVNEKCRYKLYERQEAPYLIEPYSLFGMRPVFSASYYAETEVSVMSITKQSLIGELMNYEICRMNYLNMLCNQVQVAGRKTENAHVPGGLLDKLIGFLHLHCFSLSGEKTLFVRMEDFALLVDNTRNNVSKMLNELKENELVTLNRKEIKIPSIEMLEKYNADEEAFNDMKNPFLHAYTTPRGTVPFDKITLNDYKPAIRKGIQEEDKEIQAITENPEEPTFENTVQALERAGGLLERVTTVMYNLMSAETCDELDAIAEELSPELSEHSNNISLNEALFKRIKRVYEQRDKLDLSPEEYRLLEKTYDGFVRNGANLSDVGKQQFRELSKQLSMLTLRFSQNHLKETNNYELVLTSEDQLEGLPETVREVAAHTAEEKGEKGSYVITLQAPSYVPFMKYSRRRDLRRELYLAYNTQCTHDNAQNNFEVVKQLVNLRMRMAQLLGYADYADYVLRKRMAGNSTRVYRLLDQLLEAYTPSARREVAELEAFARRLEGDGFTLQPWDFAYYAEKLKNERFHIDEESLRPYFELGRVKKGIFKLANTLYGINFRANEAIPVYHPDVQAYEVYDHDGTYLAVLYLDFYPRPGKRSGAWMTNYKEQWIDDDGQNSRPHVSITTNFTKPTAGKPALLTLSEVKTFLHEFGHALHGIFANTRFASMSGTNVYWDFVELPSQLMENYATEKKFLNTFARHYQTRRQMPEELLQGIIDASNFNVAYACLRQVSFGLLDMAWYTRCTPFEGDIRSYEHEAWKRTQLLPQVDEACMTVQFGHIMSGGYAAGYYSYKWAEVLDADAFSVFKEKGIFNPQVAQQFRRCILSAGGTDDPMTLYRNFRGKEPSIDALLERNGIKIADK